MIHRFPPNWRRCLAVVAFSAVLIADQTRAGLLTGSTESIPRGSVVDLTTNGPIDWVHWGLYTDTSVTRKLGVTPRISDFTLLDNDNSNAFVYAYQYADNYNGYSWKDGDPFLSVTNTTTGVWAYGLPPIGTGFQITVPADTAQRTLKVYVGVFAGTGRFEASLSDGSAQDYETTFSNMQGGASREVTLNFAADSPDQTLTVRWVLQLGTGLSPNVTLQAAALSAEGANNPPIVRLTEPAPNTNILAPADITLTASASDLDGTVEKVEFFSGDTKLGEATAAPFSVVWSNPLPGRYTLTAMATDNGGETTVTAPLDLTVFTSGGSLSATEALPPPGVNLTSEGTTDWAHWGLSTNQIFNRKGGVAPSIGGFEVLGTNNLNVYTDNYTAFAWTDGEPIASTTPVTHGVFVYGRGNGFEFSVPADTTPRTLRVYAGLYGAQGHFQAWLTDFSGPTYHNHSLSNLFGNDYGVFTIDYSAASAGQSLMVRYVSARLYDGDFGNVTLQAVTLSGGEPPMKSVMIVNPQFVTPVEFSFSFQSETGRSYLGQWREVPGAGDWNTFITVPGTGDILSITNFNPAGTQRFYRVETQ